PTVPVASCPDLDHTVYHDVLRHPHPHSPYVSHLHGHGNHRDLHSFPTRRSSDLEWRKPFDQLLADAPEVAGDLEWLRQEDERLRDRKSTRLNSSHEWISYAVVCLTQKQIIMLRGGLATLVSVPFHSVQGTSGGIH